MAVIFQTFQMHFCEWECMDLIKLSLKCVPTGPISNIPSLVQIMAWHRAGDKPLSEPMMVRLLTHICVTQPQWAKWLKTTTIIRLLPLGKQLYYDLKPSCANLSNCLTVWVTALRNLSKDWSMLVHPITQRKFPTITTLLNWQACCRIYDTIIYSLRYVCALYYN